jgi:hypothetical protein
MEPTLNKMELIPPQIHETSNGPEQPSREAVARMERELEHLREAVGLLGVRPCSQCGRFYRSSDPGALFACGALVCGSCIRDWWAQHSKELSVKDREDIERKLVRWLLNNHNARVTSQSAQPVEGEADEFRIVAACNECDGTGTLLKARCRYCDGRGTVWVVVPSM